MSSRLYATKNGFKVTVTEYGPDLFELMNSQPLLGHSLEYVTRGLLAGEIVATYTGHSDDRDLANRIFKRVYHNAKTQWLNPETITPNQDREVQGTETMNTENIETTETVNPETVTPETETGPIIPSELVTAITLTADHDRVISNLKFTPETTTDLFKYFKTGVSGESIETFEDLSKGEATGKKNKQGKEIKVKPEAYAPGREKALGINAADKYRGRIQALGTIEQMVFDVVTSKHVNLGKGIRVDGSHGQFKQRMETIEGLRLDVDKINEVLATFRAIIALGIESGGVSRNDAKGSHNAKDDRPAKTTGGSSSSRSRSKSPAKPSNPYNVGETVKLTQGAPNKELYATVGYDPEGTFKVEAVATTSISLIQIGKEDAPLSISIDHVTKI